MLYNIVIYTTKNFHLLQLNTRSSLTSVLIFLPTNSNLATNIFDVRRPCPSKGGFE